MGKTWKDKPAKHRIKHRSPIPPPSRVHDDKRKKTRSQERIDLKREDGYTFKDGSTVPEGYTFSE